MIPRTPLELLTKPGAMAEALALARALSRLEVVLTANGSTQRLPLQLAKGNAVISAVFGSVNVLESRFREAAISLQGFDEYVASSPPRRFLVETYSGVIGFRFYGSGNTDCSGGSPSCNVVDTWSGVRTFDPSAGTVSGESSVSRVDTVGPCGNGITTGLTSIIPRYGVEFIDFLTTATSRSMLPDALCKNFILGASRDLTLGGAPTVAQVLTSEDTEETAVARFQGATSFGPWSHAAAVARFGERTSGVTFNFTDVEFRVTQRALVPSTAYSVAVDIYRREIGSTDPFELYQTLTVEGTTDAAGVLVVTDTVPNDQGFESYAADAVLVTE